MSFIPDGTIPVQPSTGDDTLSFTDTQAAPLPSDPVIDARAQKLSYALKDQSPGVDVLKQHIYAGQEPELRASMAAKEDIAAELEKDNMLRTAGAAFGNNMSAEQAQAFLDISATKVKNDPSSAFEEAFGRAFASDVLKVSDKANEPSAQTGVLKEADVLANVTARNQYFLTGYENAQAAYDNQGFLTKAWQFGVGMLPVLPWWRQAQALSERPMHMNLLPGQTILDNVMYLHALPFDDAKRQYEAVMNSDSLNAADKLTFAQALVSYSTSDEFLSNAMGVADAVTLGSPLVKGAMRLARGAKATEDILKATEAAEAQKLLAPPEQRLLLTDQRSAEAKAGSNQFATQTDLFGDQPDQGSFRFMGTTPEQQVPNLPQERGFPPGVTRASMPGQTKMSPEDLRFGHNKGRLEDGMEKSQLPPGIIRDTTKAVQGDLDLNQPSHQGNFDFSQPDIPRPSRPLDEPPATPKTQEFKRGAAEAVKATEGEKVPKPDEVVSAQGNVPLGAVMGAVRRLLNPIGLGNSEVLKEVPTFANPMGFFQDSKVLSRAFRQRLQPQIEQSLTKLGVKISDLAKVKRLNPEQLQVAVGEGMSWMKKEYGKRFPDALNDIVHIPSEKHPANVDTLMFKLGMPDSTVFPTMDKAALFRRDVYKLGEKEAQIIPQGEGYMLGVFHHLDESSPAVLNAVDKTTNRNPLNTLFGGLLGRMRSAEDLLGTFQRNNRHIATHAPQELRRIIKDAIDDNFGTLSRKSSREVEDMLKLNRDTLNPANPSERGVWYKSAGEFETAFLDHHKKLPTEQQVAAYDAYRRLSDLDWLVRNQSAYRDKAIQGVKQFRFHYKDGEGNPAVSDWFEGKPHDAFPWSIGEEKFDSTIWVYNTQTGKGELKYKYNMTQPERKALNDMIEKEGYKVIQVHDPKTHPLDGIAYTKAGTELQDRVHYIVTQTAETGALSWKQVDYRPGGHSIYTHKWYVAQPQIQVGRKGHNTYLGDNNVLNVRTEAEARKWSEQMDAGRKMLLSGKMDELMAHIDNNLPHTREQFLDLFRRHDSPLSLHHPIVYKEAGNSTLESTGLKGESLYKDIVDGTKDPNDLSNFMDKAFLMDRDQVISGVFENPKAGDLRLTPAEQLSPYKALNQAMGQALANIWMNDYKVSAVKQWMAEFEHVMKPRDSVLLKHPLYFLYNPQYIENAASNQYADLVAAKAANAAIRNFIGTQTELGKSVNYYKTKLLNTVYNTAGQGLLLDSALGATKDPVHFFRGVAFHTKLGFFNPAQFFVQSMTMYHSLLLSPTEGLRGFSAAPLLTWLAHNPGMIDHVAAVASKVGWTKAEFKAMYSDLSRTGLSQVAGEAALRNDAYDPNLFRSTLGRFFLDLGPVFFNEGERLPRMTGFATAWREFKKANPGTKIGDYEIGTIMRRADDLAVNMTRASNASWQNGLWSIPFQFFAYNARVMEQVLGGRLTAAEKVRMLAGYSALYGLPIGLGTAVGGVFPAYDAVKEEGFKRGVNMNDGAMKVATEGLLSMAMNWLTGKDYNVAQRYGPGNQQALVDFIKGDKGVKDAVLGASGSVVGDILKTMYPFYHSVAGLFYDNGDYPLTSNDWLDAARNISTVDIGTKMYMAAQYGKWSTKSGANVAPADTMDAFAAVLGLSPQQVSDTFLWLKSIRGQKDAQNKLVEQAQQQYRLGTIAAAHGNNDEAAAYWKRAKTLMSGADLNAGQISTAFHRITSANQDLADKVRWDALKNAPASRYNNILQMLQGKQ